MTTIRLMAALTGLIFVLCVGLSAPVRAAPYAAMVMDARTGEVLHSRNADTRLHPASLTKMMTLYIAFEAVRLGEIELDTPVRISALAASEPPSKLGLRAGSTIRLRFLIRAAAIRSANDAATAIGEAIEGSEAAFARRMNRTAAALGMTRTTFRNAHGLTEEGHLSTARDMTILGRHMVYDYPEYYNIFSREEDDAGIAHVRNTNRAVLNAYSGADGIKTGYTRAAGFNLVASAQRGQERIIATVFGGQSAAWRNQQVMQLLDMGFERAPSNAPFRPPGLPQYGPDTPDSGGAGSIGLVARSLRPVPRALPAPEPALVAAIGEAVDAAVGEALAVAATPPDAAPAVASAAVAPEARPTNATPEAVAPEAVARALTEALDLPAAEAPSEDAPRIAAAAPLPRPDTMPDTMPDTEVAALAAAPEPRAPAELAAVVSAEPEVVTRASSTGSRLYGVSLGQQSSHHAAERLLLRTALSELGTFDDALRRVVQRGGGYEARFAGMTEDQAQRACARLAVRSIACEPFGP